MRLEDIALVGKKIRKCVERLDADVNVGERTIKDRDRGLEELVDVRDEIFAEGLQLRRPKAPGELRRNNESLGARSLCLVV